MLAQATRAYAAELQTIAPPAEQQKFWRCVIAQEVEGKSRQHDELRTNPYRC